MFPPYLFIHDLCHVSELHLCPLWCQAELLHVFMQSPELLFLGTCQSIPKLIRFILQVNE